MDEFPASMMSQRVRDCVCVSAAVAKVYSVAVYLSWCMSFFGGRIRTSSLHNWNFEPTDIDSVGGDGGASVYNTRFKMRHTGVQEKAYQALESNSVFQFRSFSPKFSFSLYRFVCTQGSQLNKQPIKLDPLLQLTLFSSLLVSHENAHTNTSTYSHTHQTEQNQTEYRKLSMQNNTPKYLCWAYALSAISQWIINRINHL